MKLPIITSCITIFIMSSCLSTLYPLKDNASPHAIRQYEDSDSLESIVFKSTDLFEFSIYEEMSYNLNLEDRSEISDFAFRSFKQKTKAYDPLKVIIEKTFLYLDGIADGAQYGRSMYIITKPMIGKERKLKYFNQPKELQTPCIKEIKVGYWSKLDTTVKKWENNLALVFKNDKKTYTMMGIYKEETEETRPRFELNYISNPSEFKSENRKNESGIPTINNSSKNVLIDLRNTVGLSNNKGLYFIQSENNFEFKRSAHVESSKENKEINNINSIVIHTKKKELYLIANNNDINGNSYYTFIHNEIFNDYAGHWALLVSFKLQAEEKSKIKSEILKLAQKDGKKIDKQIHLELAKY